MVIVTNEPYTETDPSRLRRNSYEEAYRNITSSMNAELEIADPNLACKLLSTAVSLQNMPLAKQCIEILDRHLDRATVLPIYAHLSQCKMPPPHNPRDFEPSAPPIVEKGAHPDWVAPLTDGLRHNCLLEIDRHAEHVLRQPELLDLSYGDLLAVITRDSLECSEPLVYAVVVRWATRECHRRTLLPHMVNVRAVVRELRHAPRFGLMTRAEFCARKLHGERGPTRSDILEEAEWRKIQFYIREKAKGRPVEELPFKMSQARVAGAEKPRLLSAQSSVRAMAGRRKKLTACSSMTSCDKFLLNCITCWAAIFD